MRGLVSLMVAVCSLLPVNGQQSSPAKNSRTNAVRVPIVGCASDGQVGPLPAPKAGSKTVPLASETAAQLAYYHAEHGVGVLAPRGWHCFSTYGSSGANSYVTPEPIDPKNLFSSSWSGFRGPVIQISYQYGDTSGRFGVARMIARVFPAHQTFVKAVVAERIEPADSFPAGPFANDKLTYKSKEVAEYETPPQTDGLGTNSRLEKNSAPISGAAMLVGETPDLVFLAVRLPQGLSEFLPGIIGQAERDAASTK